MVNFNVHGMQTLPSQEPILRELAYGKKRILEVGCWTGQSTAILAKEAKECGGEIYVVDWWKGNPGTSLVSVAQATDVYSVFESNMKELGLFDCMKVYKMDAREAHKELEDNFFDLIYIDADHRYSGMIQDINNYYPKLRDGGTFAGHDFESMTYNEAHIEEDYVGDKHNGVIKAVTEIFPEVEMINGMWIGTRNKK